MNTVRNNHNNNNNSSLYNNKSGQNTNRSITPKSKLNKVKTNNNNINKNIKNNHKNELTLALTSCTNNMRKHSNNSQ